MKIETINERSDDKVRIKIERIDELKHSNEGVKIKIDHTNQLKHFDNEGVKIKIDHTDQLKHFDNDLKGKIKKLQSKIMCQNNK